MRIKTRYKIQHYAVAVGCFALNMAVALSVWVARVSVPVPAPVVAAVSNVVAFVSVPVAVAASNVVAYCDDFYSDGIRAYAFGRLLLAGDLSPWGVVRAVFPGRVVVESESAVIEIKAFPLGEKKAVPVGGAGDL